MNVKLPRFQCFRAGKQVASDGRELEFSEADLAASVKAYDPAKSKAPIVIGHPKQSAPAYGWIDSMSTDGDLMYATGDDVMPEFAEMVKDKRFAHRSISFYAPASASNPVPGVYYPRHMAFLGATPPAVKGLKDIEFAGADADVIEIEFNEGDALDRFVDLLVGAFEKKFGASRKRTNDKTQPEFSEEETAVTDAEKLKLEQDRIANENAKKDIDKKNVEFAEREKVLAAKEKAGREKGFVEFVEGLVKAGKVLPRQKATAIALLAAAGAIEGENAIVEFSEGEGDKATKVKKPVVDLLQGLLSDLPKQIDFKEHSKSDGKDDALDFADASALEAAAQVYIAEQKKLGKDINIAEAVQHVKKTAAK